MIPIITLNWNGLSDTLECVEALEKQSYQDFMLYLVDNGSEADNVEVLTEKFGNHPKINLILNKENLGFTKGNNVIMRQLLEEGKYEYIALLNNDTAVHEDWLKNLVESAKRNNADVVTSKMINYFNRKVMDNAGHWMLNTAEIIPIGHAEPIENYTEYAENIGACAGAALYSTKMLNEIGVFDEYFETGYEDAEIGLRANILGYKTIFEPTAICNHKVKQSINKIMNFEYILKIQLNILYTYFKLMPWGVILINLPSFLFKYIAIIIIDIVFIRPKFLKVMVYAWYRTFFQEWGKIRKSRKAFFKKHKPISSFKILKKMEFFLWFDIKRFWKYVILRQNTEFEKYND